MRGGGGAENNSPTRKCNIAKPYKMHLTSGRRNNASQQRGSVQTENLYVWTTYQTKEINWKHLRLWISGCEY
jgi:hypothetical protein